MLGSFLEKFSFASTLLGKENILTHLRLQEKVALITGGGSGMGEAIAKLFAQEGASIVVTGRREEPLKQTVSDIIAQGGRATYLSGDVSRWEEAKAMIDFTIQNFGHLDVLVPCAGIVRRTEKIEETTEEQWSDQIDINLKGTFALIKFALPHMMEQRRGGIVAISSTMASLAAPGYATYAASKGGVSALIRVVAVQYASYGIRANAICPGMTHTPMAYVDRPRPFNEIVNDVLEQGYPIKRVGQPEDVAKAALFLATDESSYLTGQNIFVDGGFSIK